MRAAGVVWCCRSVPGQAEWVALGKTSHVEVPETRYADTAVGRIAYQVVGDGPIDVLVEGRAFLPIDLMWEEPSLVRFLDRLSTFCRHVWFDPRGRGASDPVSHEEGRLAESVSDDMVALLDVLALSEVALLGLAGVHELLFAATHPARVKALVLAQPSARFRWAEDYTNGLDDVSIESLVSAIERGWGTGANLNIHAPRMANDARFARWFARCERMAMNPAEAGWRYRATYDIDLRHALATITVPSLVICGHDPMSRFVEAQIAGCRHADGPEPGHLFFTGDSRPMLDAIEEFLTGRLPNRRVDRVLATVLFTDVVDSTPSAARLGDRRWLQLLANHNAAIRVELTRFRGREVRSTGDGFLATFDGPGRAIRAAQAITAAVRVDDPAARHRSSSRAPCRRDRARRRRRHRRRRRPHRPARLYPRPPRRGSRLQHGQGSRRRIRHRVHRPG